MKCNNCNAKNIKVYMKNSVNDMVRCEKCGLVFVKKMPSKKTISDYYQDEFYDKEKSERFGELFEMIVGLSRFFRARAIGKLCRKPGRMADVGFSRGTTMKMLRSKGWQTFGTQISLNSYNNAKKNNLNVFLGDLKSAKIPSRSVDLITFWHVLEHLRNPDSYLQEANRILSNNGKLVVEVPNIGSPVAKLFRKKWAGLDLPRHLYHFSSKSLKSIVKKNSFKIAGRKYFSFEQSIFSMLQSVLNLFNCKNNVFFDSIKKNKKVDLFSKVYNWILALIFIAPCAVLSWILGLFRLGDVMRFYCIKVKDESDR